MNSKTEQKALSAAELRTLLEEDREVVLIDLLPPDHFAMRHIPGALNVCVFQVTFLHELASITGGEKGMLVVYGSGSKSHDAAVAMEKMARAGYSGLSFLEGGLDAWSAAGFPLTGDGTEQPDDPQTLVRLPEGNYAVDPQASRLEWAGRNANNRHNGTVDISSGSLDIEGGKLSGSIEVDMTSIRNTNLQGDDLQPVLEDHLRSDDFFFTSMFPRAIFTFKETEKIGPGWSTGPNYRIDGQLELRGVSAGLAFDATATIGQNGSPALEAHFDLDRTRWGIIYGSARYFEHLGMHQVFDLISLQLRLYCRSVIAL